MAPADPFAPIETRIQQIAILEREVADRQQRILERRCVSLLLAPFADLQGEERQRAIWKLYWEYPQLPVTEIAVALGVSPNNVAKLAGPAYRKLPCVSCKQLAYITATSREEMRGQRPTSVFTRCDECEERRKEQHEAWLAQLSEEAGETKTDGREKIAIGPTVEELRAMPYSDYLRSEHWQQIRLGALRRAGYRCQVCNSDDPLHVHHRTYVRRGQERDLDLIALCAACHGAFHEQVGGATRRSLHEDDEDSTCRS